jgi:NodT family efflux transporter outer membrane factor (OMF) lipoprotein
MTVRLRERLRCALGTVSCTGLLAACSVGPNFTRPTPQMPAHWPQPVSATAPTSPGTAAAPSTGAAATPSTGTAAGSAAGPSIVNEQTAELREWWSDFNDPMLNSLVSRALSSNLDLRAAVLRIEESRAQRDITSAGRWPTLSANAAYSRTRLSENTPTGSLFSSVGNIKLPGGAGVSIPNPYSQYQLSADASWEIDLFGRLRRSVEAAEANVQVAVEDQRAVQVSLVSDVAQSYLALRGAQARLQVANDNLAIIDELLDLTRQRQAAGLTTDLDVSNALAQASATRADLPSYGLQITQSINQLSQLLAREPEALRAELGSAAPLPAVPPSIPIGVPAELARRRPDIREAEAGLHAATAQIGVAVANLYPRLTLSANGGFQSETAGKLLEWASRFGTLGPTLELPIFDRGRWKTVHLNDLRSQEAAIAYQRTVLSALHEVDNALSAYAADQRRQAWLDAAVAQNQDALALARQRYAGGISTFIDVLDAERTLRQNELSRTDSVTAVAIDLVRMYRALGGGWQSGPTTD